MGKEQRKASNTTVQDSPECKYYAFISYKHRNNGKFTADAAWAYALERELRRLHIPTVINREGLIRESDDSVNPVFRDASVLATIRKGMLPSILEKKLQVSKTLVLILSKDMVADQNALYNPNPKKSVAWVYWEVKTFLKYHPNQWERIIPVYIDPDEYNPAELDSKIKLGFNYDNIEKPWHDYKNEYDWDTQKDYLYRRVAASVASSIFSVEKDAFWNLKERELKALEAERRAVRIHKKMLRLVILALTVIIGLVAWHYASNWGDSLVKEAREMLSEGNRLKASELARKAHWIPGVQGAAEVMWAAGDSTRPVMMVRSRVVFDSNDSLFTYVDKNRYVVISDARTFKEIERIDAGKASSAYLSPSARRVFVVQPGTFNPDYAIYDRETCCWEGISHSYGRGFRANDALLYNNRMVMMMGTRRSVYLNDQEDSSFYPEDVSFMATDSLLLASRRTDGQGTGYQLFLYNFMDRNNRSAYSNCFGPSAAFALPPGTRGVTLAQTSNDVISVTADSIYLWKVEHAGGQYLLREVCSDSTPAPIREIRLSERDARALVFDDKGGAYRYFLSNNTSLRIWRLYDGNYISDNDRITIEPLCIGPQGGVLAYLKGEDGVNLKEPPYVGFRLALMEKRSHISAETHGGVTSVQVEDLSSEGAVRTYLYSGGDGRVVTPNGISTVLSSSYYVSYTNDFLCERISEGVTRWYSGPCLFDARSGDHLMHLALKEDRKPDNCRYEDAFLEGDQLAAVFRRADGRKILRFYSISGKSFVKERTLKDNCQFFGWMSDGYFLYESGDTLYRDHPKATLRAQVLCDSFDGMLGPNSPDYFRFFKRSDGGVYWFSTSDGKVRETKMGLHFSPDGGVFTRIGDNHPTTFSIIDSRTLDTLHTRNVEGWGGFEKFSRDSRKFLCSEDGRQVTCLDVPSGRNLWKVDIWAPISCVAGSKYAVLQSNSLFVLDLSDGSVVCEFETNPEKRSELMLSPDEHWLLADRKLYSLRTRELISADVDDGYTSLEDEYILYPKRIMRLPNEKNLFNNTEKMK